MPARGSKQISPIQEMWKNRQTSLLAGGLCGWSCLSCFANTARALKPKFEATVAMNAAIVPPASPADAIPTPITTGKSDAYVAVRSTSPSRKYANTTVEIGSPDFTVSTKDACARENAKFVKKKPK